MSFPDFLLDPNVVLKDDAKWRYKSAPDYGNTNAAFEATKSTNWAPTSLEFLIQNLVKNWEKEASYKTDPKEWRTISQDKYAFHLNSSGAGQGQSAADMLRVGTYNALIGEKGIKDVYETKEMDFASSHKLFKGVIRTFNWEVLEVLGGPPKVSIKWRHWGTMTGNYRAKLSSGRTVTAEANQNLIEVFGVTLAEVNDKFEITKLETFWDPESMFRQLVTDGVKVLEDGETVETIGPGVGEVSRGEGEARCPLGH